jgi:hypothetical protein
MSIDIESFYGCKSLTKMFHKFLQKLEYKLFAIGYMSHVVSYNSTQTLRFKCHVTFSTSYELQIFI